MNTNTQAIQINVAGGTSDTRQLIISAIGETIRATGFKNTTNFCTTNSGEECATIFDRITKLNPELFNTPVFVSEVLSIASEPEPTPTVPLTDEKEETTEASCNLPDLQAAPIE